MFARGREFYFYFFLTVMSRKLVTVHSLGVFGLYLLLCSLPKGSLSFFESLVAGGTAGAIAKTLIAPLERQKILFQISPHKAFSFRNAFVALKDTYQNQGVRALYRGNGAQMWRIVPYASVQYMSHEQLKRFAMANHDGELTPLIRFACGAAAGAASVAVTYPLDLMRARLAIATGSHVSLIRTLVLYTRTEGYRALFQGLAPTLVGQVFYSGLAFGTFETLKSVVRARRRSEGAMQDITVSEKFRCGAFSGLFAQSATYPLDVVRRRMQTDNPSSPLYIGIWKTLSTIYRNEGLKGGLYKGLSMNWVKGPIAVGVSFTVYDHVKGYFLRKKRKASN